MAVQLETERLVLRWFTLDDLEAYNELGTNPLLIRYVGNQGFASLDAARAMMISAPLTDYVTYGYGRFACVLKHTGTVVGFCGPKFLAESGDVDLGYRFLPEFWGLGLATESSLAVIDYARDQLRLRELVAWIHPENVASARVVTKLGFSLGPKTTIPSIAYADFDLYAKRLDGLTDSEIAACTVGELKPHAGVIVIAEYDAAWPGVFEGEARRIRAALGGGVLRLEHVGSTSVPGLAAKPRIDMLLVVRDSADEGAYVGALEGVGYVLRIREPDWHEHRVFVDPVIELNLHVFSPGCVEIERMLAFRDWLRSDADDRALYERTKRELAARQWKHVQNYADAKTDVVTQILARALAAPR